MSELDAQQLNELYSWIDEATLSRPKRNISRDFSDGVLMAELISNYYPKLVDIHNYPTSSSLKAKVNNWNTLNIKVLSKLDLALPPELINDIANSKPFAIQRVLMDLKTRIEAYEQQGPQTTNRRKQDHLVQNRPKQSELSKVDQLKLVYRLLNEKVQSMEKTIKKKDEHIQELQKIISEHKK